MHVGVLSAGSFDYRDSQWACLFRREEELLEQGRGRGEERTGGGG